VPRPSPDAPRLAAVYRIGALLAPFSGAPGSSPARGTGSSVEFHERRPYVAGDDVRHVDWRALARTGEVYVRLHRAEVTPRLDLVFDDSASIATDEAKARLATDLAALLASAARGDGLDARVIVAGDRAAAVPADRFAEDGARLLGREPLARSLAEVASLVRDGSLRVVVSDFLFPHAARDLVRPLAARAGALVLVQILSEFDADPGAEGLLRLVDSETSEEVEVDVDPRAVSGYRARLRRLSGALAEECRRAGATFATLVASAQLSAHCRGTLVAAGLLAPR